MATETIANSQNIHVRRSSETKVANVDLNQFYLVENIHTKQRHVITHLFVKYDPTGMSSNVQCKLTPRGTRFDAKILLQGHKDECEKKINELRVLGTPTKTKKTTNVNETSTNQASTLDKTNQIQRTHVEKQQPNIAKKLSNKNDQIANRTKKLQPTIIRKKKIQTIRRRKLFGTNNTNSLFEIPDVPSPTSSSSLSRTPISSLKKPTLNSNQSSPLVQPTTSNILSTLENSSDDEDELGSDINDLSDNDNANEEEDQLSSNMDVDVQNLLDNEEDIDLDKLKIEYANLQSAHKNIKDAYSKLKTKYTELKQNTIPKPPAGAHEWLIQLGRLCDAKPTPTACSQMAKTLGMDALELINIIGNSKTQTARNIVHTKLTPEQKATLTHKNFPKHWRNAIHDFIRIIATGEPYSKYKINEAINGSLREAKRALLTNS